MVRVTVVRSGGGIRMAIKRSCLIVRCQHLASALPAAAYPSPKWEILRAIMRAHHRSSSPVLFSRPIIPPHGCPTLNAPFPSFFAVSIWRGRAGLCNHAHKCKCLASHVRRIVVNLRPKEKRIAVNLNFFRSWLAGSFFFTLTGKLLRLSPHEL